MKRILTLILPVLLLAAAALPATAQTTGGIGIPTNVTLKYFPKRVGEGSL
jgi:hypothetical protein